MSICSLYNSTDVPRSQYDMKNISGGIEKWKKKISEIWRHSVLF